jgi:hypothetical protein
MNKLISFGDSFTWGSELKDDLTLGMADPKGYIAYKKYAHATNPMEKFSEPDFNHKVTWSHSGSGYSRHTWPALYATSKNMEYRCFAQPGCSNSSISRRFFKFLPNIDKTDLVIVNWTWIDRWDVFDTNGEVELANKMKNAVTAKDVHVQTISLDNWVTLRPSDASKDELSKLYFKYLQSELWSKFESLKLMMLVSATLKSKNIPFAMTCVDKLAFDKTYHCPDYINNIQSELEDDFIWFENMGFYEWAVSNNFDLGEDGHPLEEAHIEAFKYIEENYDLDKYTKDNS